MGNLALLCDQHHDHLHRPGWAAALTDDHTLLVWKPSGTLLNAGALRPSSLSGAKGAKGAKSAEPATAAGDERPRSAEDAGGVGLAEVASSDEVDPSPTIDVSRRLHGVGERMDAWALDTYLHFWLEATAAA